MSKGFFFSRSRRWIVAVGIIAVVLLAFIPSCGNLRSVAIHNAAEKGDFAKVKAMISDNPDLISSKDNYGHEKKGTGIFK